MNFRIMIYCARHVSIFWPWILLALHNSKTRKTQHLLHDAETGGSELSSLTLSLPLWWGPGVHVWHQSNPAWRGTLVDFSGFPQSSFSSVGPLLILVHPTCTCTGIQKIFIKQCEKFSINFIILLIYPKDLFISYSDFTHFSSHLHVFNDRLNVTLFFLVPGICNTCTNSISSSMIKSYSFCLLFALASFAPNLCSNKPHKISFTSKCKSFNFF